MTKELETDKYEEPSKEEEEVSCAMQIEQVSAQGFKQDPENTRQLVYSFFKKLLKEWEQHLDSQPEEEKKTSQGRMNLVAQKQSKDSLKPFFKQLKKGELAQDMTEKVVKICAHMQLREYVKANDAYLQLAIGNAAWPIGVTMVGIHERSAHEKISTSQTARTLECI